MHLRVAAAILLCCAAAMAQVEGEVESIGFARMYRPGDWTPLLVRLRPKTAEPATYQLQVLQEDADGDIVRYTRPIALAGQHEGGGAADQRFWTYFIPRLTRDSLDGSLKELRQKLRVQVCTEAGRPITTLAISDQLSRIDSPRSTWTSERGQRLMLCVSDDPGRQPPWRELADPSLRGVMENLLVLVMRPRDLPENVLGYESVDAILWLGADPMSSGVREDKLPAVEAFVRRGGQLLISQNSQWQKMTGLGNLLPVIYPRYESSGAAVQGTFNRGSAEPLAQLAFTGGKQDDTWAKVRGPITFALAEARSGGIVEHWLDWPGAPTGLPRRSPFVVRYPLGLGSVTWIGVDLADPAITRTVRSGWYRLWDRLLDANNSAFIIDPTLTEDQQRRQEAPFATTGNAWDLGPAFNSGMEHGRTVAAYLVGALAFLIVYWLAAGPGVYLFLLSRRQTRWSWAGFAAVAVAGTLLTALTVKLVLRGPPRLRHVSIVRTGPRQPAVVFSRMGLYIPRDGNQRLELADTASDSLSYLAPFSPHSAHIASDATFPSRLTYSVNVRDLAAIDAPSLVVPYRSTLKKFEAVWHGEAAGIDGSAMLLDAANGYISGKLVNGTGRELREVYLAFRYPLAGESLRQEDWVLYLGQWPKDITLDLNDAFNKNPADGGRVPFVGDQLVPGKAARLRGRIGTPEAPLEWARYWQQSLRIVGQTGDEMSVTTAAGNAVPFPLLSLFGRLPPVRNSGTVTREGERYELLRRGTRFLDISHALAAGRLIVLAQADGPLPFALNVQGSRVGGEGTIFYQCEIPLTPAATTRPATQP